MHSTQSEIKYVLNKSGGWLYECASDTDALVIVSELATDLVDWSCWCKLGKFVNFKFCHTALTVTDPNYEYWSKSNVNEGGGA